MITFTHKISVWKLELVNAVASTANVWIEQKQELAHFIHPCAVPLLSVSPLSLSDAHARLVMHFNSGTQLSPKPQKQGILNLPQYG